MIIKYKVKEDSWVPKYTSTFSEDKEIEGDTIEDCFDQFWKKQNSLKYCNDANLIIEEQYKEQYQTYNRNMNINKYAALGGDMW